MPRLLFQPAAPHTSAFWRISFAVPLRHCFLRASLPVRSGSSLRWRMADGLIRQPSQCKSATQHTDRCSEGSPQFLVFSKSKGRRYPSFARGPPLCVACWCLVSCTASPRCCGHLFGAVHCTSKSEMAATATKANANATWMLLRQGRQYRPPNPRRTCGVIFQGSTPNCAASSRCYRTGAGGGHLSVGGASVTFGDSATGDGVSSSDPKQGREQFVVTGSLLDARRAGSDSPLPGQFLSISHAFGPEAVAAFAAHAGDDNPIHLDDNYAKQTG